MNTTPDRYVIHDMSEPMGDDWGFFVFDTETATDIARCDTEGKARRVARTLNLLNELVSPMDHTS